MGMDTKYDQFYAADGARPKPQTVESNGWPRNRVQAIASLPLKGDTILDIGCGGGDLLFQFKERFRVLIGLEFSSQRLATAGRNLADCNFHGVCGSAENMSEIETGSVDCIVTADVIEHIPDVYAACDEMFRVLKPGGVLAVNTPNVAFFPKRLKLLCGRFPSTSQPNEGLGSDVLFDGGHLHYFTYRSLRLLLERSGFDVERKLGFGRLGVVHNVLPEWASVGVQWVARKPLQVAS